MRNKLLTDLFLFSTAMFVFSFSFGNIVTVHPLYLKSFVKLPMLVGLLASVVYASELFLNVPAGLLSDRFGSLRLLALGFLFMPILLFSYAMNYNLVLLIILQVIMGVLSAVIWISSEAFIKEISPIDRRGEFRAFYGSFVNAGLLFGPLTGGFLARKFGIRFPYMFALFFLALSLLLLKPIKHGYQKQKVLPYKGFFSEKLSLLRNNEMRMLFLSSVSLYFWYSSKWTFGPLLLESLGFDEWEIGIWLSASVIPFLLLQIPFGRISDRVGKKEMIFMGFIFSSSFLLPLGFLSNFIHLVLVITLISVGTALIEPLIEARVADLVPKERYGRYSGVMGTGKTLGLMIGPVFSSAIIHSFGLPYAFMPSFIVFVLTAVYSYMPR